MNDWLESWKEIANYLKRDIRTVQRWEQTRGLPVQRLTGGKRDLITARKSEIDLWWQNGARQLDAEEAPPEAPPPRRTQHVLWVAPALASAVIVWFLVPRESVQEPALKPVPLTSYPGRELEPCFSPDGSQVAFSWNGDAEDNFDIYIKVVGTDKPLRLTSHPGVDINPAWSPDGRSIAFLREVAGGKAEIHLVPALGGPERKVGEVDTLGRSRCPLLAWAPDGNNLLVVHRLSASEPYGLFVISLTGAPLRRLTLPPPGGRGDSGVAFSPDGRTLVFSRMLAGPGKGDLYLLPLTEYLSAQGDPSPLTSWNRITVGPAWASNGREVVVTSSPPAGTLWRVPIEAPDKARQLQSLGEEAYQPVISQPRRGAPSLIFVRQFSDDNIWSASLQRGTRTQLITSTRSESCAQFSPDGSRIAFLSDRTGLPQIYLSKPDGSNAVQLASDDGLYPGPIRWSPEGQRLVFGCRAPEGIAICVVDVKGGPPRRLTDGRSHDTLPSFSSDGQWIYFGSNRSGGHQLWKIPAAGGKAVQVTKNGGWGALESHDGRRLYYVKDSGIHPPLWSVPVSGGEERQVLESVRARAFAVTERGIFFIPRLSTHGRGSLRFFDFKTGSNTIVAHLDKPTGMLLSVSPDGRTILYTQTDREGSDLMLVENFR
jgi:Tol biopolymer transport system component